jgi:hypothetical protein
MAAGVFFASYSGGVFVGPMLQGVISVILKLIFDGTYKSVEWYRYNFRYTSYIMGVIVFLCFIIYGFIGEAFSKGWSPQIRIFKGKLHDIH